MKKKVITLLLIVMMILLAVLLISYVILREGKFSDSSSISGNELSQTEEQVVEEKKPAVISAAPVIASPGDTDIEYVITITDNPGILGLLLSVSFDEEHLTLTNADNGEAFSALSITKPGAFNSGCRILWDGVEIAGEEIKDGTILKLYFAVSDDAPNGTYPITLSCIDGSALDNELKSVNTQIENESITVTQK